MDPDLTDDVELYDYSHDFDIEVDDEYRNLFDSKAQKMGSEEDFKKETVLIYDSPNEVQQPSVRVLQTPNYTYRRQCEEADLTQVRPYHMIA